MFIKPVDSIKDNKGKTRFDWNKSYQLTGWDERGFCVVCDHGFSVRFNWDEMGLVFNVVAGKAKA